MTEDIALEALTDFLNAVETGIESARQRIKEGKMLWNPSCVRWTNAEGAKGPYECSEDVDNPEFKAMVKDLADHNGKLTRDGFFYWQFEQGSSVGRKKRK